MCSIKSKIMLEFLNTLKFCLNQEIKIYVHARE